MNKENLLLLAARLRAPETEKHFSMGDWYAAKYENRELSIGEGLIHCGTVACIAGHAAAMANPALFGVSIIQTQAESWLQLTPAEGTELFYPNDICYDLVTPLIAAEVVEHFANTGKIVWPPEVESDYEGDDE